MAQIAELTCHICENTNGRYFCYDCHIILCDKCKKDHYKYPANKHHTIKEYNSKVLPVKYECEQHHKDYLHYCQNCECLICSECITVEHNGHVFKDIKSITDNARKTVLDAICNLKTKQQNSTSAKDEINSSKIVKIQTDTEKFISEVHCLSKSLKEIIETEVKTESTFAGDFLNLEKTKLESFLETLNESVDVHSSIINKLEDILLEAHDVTFYFNQAKILNEIQRSESDDIPIFEEVKDLQAFETADFIDKVVEKINIKHGIR
ncbi:transcription intermediary factor 1-alpha-like [Mytilus edulis]|uniref:transcription intermediary factor 1-alpha-like n=1 Tax=Mytilus edulis TaxID=6550 RepID=UPI0039F0E9B3